MWNDPKREIEMKWGLVGASTIAQEHVLPALRAEGQDVCCVMSASPDRAASFAQTHDIPRATSDIADLLSDPDIQAVYISSTNEKHLPQTLAAIAAGKHVLCEKPLAMTVADAARMVGAADRAGVVLATNHHLRCSGSHRRIRDLIVSGAIGKVLSIRVHHAVHLPPHLRGWRINNAEAGGGVIPDITVHDADVVRFLLGEDPLHVVAQSLSSGMGEGVEDSCMSVWTMPSGAMVFSHESFTHPFAGSGLEVHGTEGSIVARKVMTQRPIGEITLTDAQGSRHIAFLEDDLYRTGVAEFVAATGGKGSPAATGLDGLKSLAIALAVRKAAETGKRQPVEFGEY